MNLSWIKIKKKIKKISILVFVYSFFIILGDLIYSNFGNIKDINYNCFQFYNLTTDEKKYHYYDLKKNCTATESSRTVVPYNIYTDENGYRYSGKSRKNIEKNILFVGDSQTYGYGVKYEDSFSGIIQTSLNKYEIYNLAVPSYGIRMYLKRIEDFYNKNKKATHIFVTLDMTDVIDASFRWHDIEPLEIPVIKSHRAVKEVDDWDKIKDSNFKGTRLLTFYIRNYLRSIRKNFFINNNKNEDTALKSDIANFTYEKINKENTTFLTNESFDLSLIYIDEYFGKISNLAKKNNTQLYLIIFPWPENLIHGQKVFNWENYTNKICKKHRCKKVINLFKDFEDIKKNNPNWKKLIYIDDDIHLKKYGNSILANKILNEVIFD